METSLPPEPGLNTWAEQFAALLQTERDRAGEFIAAEQTRLEQAEAVIEEELSRLEEQARSAAALAEQGRKQGDTLDWEAEKCRILAALESDGDENDSDQRAERLKIENVLQTTEKIVAEKDREIQQLKRRLEELSPDAEARAASAATIAQAIDVDGAVREERERLRQLQDEWREKLRQAEIDLSVERAKLARQRAGLEDRTPSAPGDLPPGSAEATADDASRSAPGHWLAKLGLTEADRVCRRKR